MRFVTALVCVTLVGRAFAQDDAKLAQARELAAEGDKALADGDAATALTRYQDAYAIYPSPNLRYNVGLALVAQGRDPEAMAEFTTYLSETNDLPDDARAYALDQITAIRPKVGALMVSSSTRDAQVTVNGKFVGYTPLDRPVYVTPGAHHIELTAPEGSCGAFDGDVNAVGGADTPVDAELSGGACRTPRVEPPRDTPGTPPPVNDQGRGLRLTGIVMGATGGVVLLTGAFFGFEASAAASDVESYRGDWGPAQQTLQDRGKRDEAIGIVLVSFGAASAITGGILYYVGEHRRHAPLDFVVAPTRGGAITAIGGRF